MTQQLEVRRDMQFVIENGQSSSAGEICPITGCNYVAYDPTTEKLLCNKCIFEQNLDGLQFTALVTRQLKTIFDQKYDEYRKSHQRMQHLSPKHTSIAIKKRVEEFFSEFLSRLKRVE